MTLPLHSKVGGIRCPRPVRSLTSSPPRLRTLDCTGQVYQRASQKGYNDAGYAAPITTAESSPPLWLCVTGTALCEGTTKDFCTKSMPMRLREACSGCNFICDFRLLVSTCVYGLVCDSGGRTDNAKHKQIRTLRSLAGSRLKHDGLSWAPNTAVLERVRVRQ